MKYLARYTVQRQQTIMRANSLTVAQREFELVENLPQWIWIVFDPKMRGRHERLSTFNGNDIEVTLK